jgi:putative ABC transport system ATP-binding protein
MEGGSEVSSSSSASIVVNAQGLGKSYQMGEHTVTALEDVSLIVRDGDYVAITGPSGSGKSTLMHLIGSLDVPTSGRLEIAGRDITHLSANELAGVRNEVIGFVFQSFNLVPRMSALAQVMLPLAYARNRPSNARALAQRRLEDVGLGDRGHHYPQQLSGGQQQRVAIARALITNPRLLLADEPTGALDSRTSDDIMALFERLNTSGIAVVIVTHDRDIARRARSQIVLRDGHVVADTPALNLSGAA